MKNEADIYSRFPESSFLILIFSGYLDKGIEIESTTPKKEKKTPKKKKIKENIIEENKIIPVGLAKIQETVPNVIFPQSSMPMNAQLGAFVPVAYFLPFQAFSGAWPSPFINNQQQYYNVPSTIISINYPTGTLSNFHDIHSKKVGQ